MTTGQKIYEARRKAGMTQEELAERLGVSRQAVSKWESDAAFPETEKILELCKLFGISADELLFSEKGSSEGKAEAQEANKQEWGWIAHSEKLHYEYISKTKVHGIPLVHINFGFGFYRAKGIFAAGNIAIGVVSAGLLSVGVLAAGVLALGLLAFGSVVLGLLVGAGGVAIGALAFGGVAIGVMAFGGVSIGYVAVGGLSVGHYAIGGWASGWLAVGKTHASGTHAFLALDDASALSEFLSEQNFPSLIKHIIETCAYALRY